MHYIYGLTNSLYLRLIVSHLWSVSHLLVSQKPLPEVRVIGRCDRGKGGGGGQLLGQVKKIKSVVK